MRWEWDENKNHANRRKHGLGFETARLVFDDPLMAHHRDDRRRGRHRGAHMAPSAGRNRRRDGPHHQRQKGHGAREESL